jgi:hypothetical protein
MQEDTLAQVLAVVEDGLTVRSLDHVLGNSDPRIFRTVRLHLFEQLSLLLSGVLIDRFCSGKISDGLEHGPVVGVKMGHSGLFIRHYL